MAKVLIVEDDVAFCKMLETFLNKKGFETAVSFNGEEALAKISKQPFDVILTDVRLPDKDGTVILEEVTRHYPEAKVILMTGYAEVNLAVDAIKKGAYDYISKPVNPEKMLEVIQQAFKEQTREPAKDSGKTQPEMKPKNRRASLEKSEKKPQKEGSFVSGISDVSKKLDDYIKLVAPTNMSVLIIGDSGTGKEYVAKKIHDQSKRANQEFVPVDCGAIPKEIASSEFFGHVKGSFTGAVNDKIGHFQAANKGTLFLDEIGNLNYELQVQLLRALQERKIKPVGSNKEIEVDIRIVAATNEDLSLAVDEGEFREDLFHRLNEFSIQLPSLKQRREDILLFANHFLEIANDELDKNIVGFAEDTLELFKRYPWPGNLREMQNSIKRAVLLCQDKLIYPDALPNTVQEGVKEKKEDYGLFKNKNEEELILEALEETNGNKSKAARLLSIDRKTLYNKLKQYGIKN